jgi:hypothetical protein
MNKKNLYYIWAGLFILTALLGFITEPNGLLKALMVMAAVGFFVPPALLLKQGDFQDIKLVRNLSLVSLITTTVLLVLNVMSVLASEAVGTGLYALLILLSAPMVCSQYWALSMFLWACLLMVSLKLLKK